MTLDEFREAVEFFNIITRITKEDLRKKYLELSKAYHPDLGGDEEKFKKLNKSYKILLGFINGYRFEFSEDEFKKQFPLSDFDSRFWF
ncbi:MAG: J domain-containing protein [Campylobacteraceae bacterium]|nr:J domain-containing protein [Campylobacteraceae bacterium]